MRSARLEEDNALLRDLRLRLDAEELLGAPITREVQVSVKAPAGKLQVLFEDDPNGVAFVAAVRKVSPVADKLLIGDCIVAVDLTTTKGMNVSQLVAVLTEKENQNERNMTVLRKLSFR